MRWTFGIIVLALSATMLVSGVIGRYVRTDLLNTNTNVSATAPLAGDPAIRTAIADQVTNQITTHLNAASLQRHVEALAKRFGLPAGAGELLGTVSESVASFVRRTSTGSSPARRLRRSGRP